MGNLLRGDFGTTVSDGRPVTEVILNYGAATVELVFYALIVAFIIGIPLGMLAAYKRDKAPDAALRILAILGYATPVFFAGMILKLIFGVYFPILPVAGRGTTETEYIMSGVVNPTRLYIVDAIRIGNIEVLGDVLAHAVLPAIALGILTAGVFLRLVRTNLIGTLGQQYIDSGRSRGISEFRLVTKHAYRPALIPIITVMGMQIASCSPGRCSRRRRSSGRASASNSPSTSPPATSSPSRASSSSSPSSWRSRTSWSTSSPPSSTPE